MKWTVGKRLILSFSLMAALMTLVCIFSINNLNELKKSTEVIMQEHQSIITEMATIDTSILFHSLKVDQFVTSGNRAHLRTVNTLRENVETNLSLLEKQTKGTGDQEDVNKIREAYDTYISLSEELREFYRNNPDDSESIRGRRIRISAILENAVLSRSETMYMARQNRSQALVKDNHRFFLNSIRITVILCFVIIILAISLSFFIARSIINPVNELVDAAKKVAQGDLTARAHTTVPHEIGLLAGAFNQMTRKLQGLVENLELSVADRTRQLSEERNFVTTILDTASALVLVLGRDGRIIRFNAACEQTTGYRFDEVKDRYMWDFFIPLDKIEKSKNYFYQLNADEFPIKNEHHWITKNGRRRLISWSNAVIPDKDGSIGYIISIGLDITEQKQTEKELKKSYKALETSLKDLKDTQDQLVRSEKMAALGDLVAGVAHEISTPLGVGVMSASFLLDITMEHAEYYKDNTLSRSMLEKYYKNAKEASSLIYNNLSRAADLLNSFKQVAVDQSGDERRNFILKEYIDEILVSLLPRYKNDQHSIEVNCPDNIILDSYPSAIYQILTNLIINSMIHGFEGIRKGTISIDVSVNDNELLFKYSDNGRGMNEEVINKIFTPFFTTKRGQGGSGLGMHIVYNIVTQSLGGQIECASSQGNGALICMSIPLNGVTGITKTDGKKYQNYIAIGSE